MPALPCMTGERYSKSRGYIPCSHDLVGCGSTMQNTCDVARKSTEMGKLLCWSFLGSGLSSEFGCIPSHEGLVV